MPLFGKNKTPPKEFLCPLATRQEVMVEPVIYQGATYDKANIEKHLKSQNKSGEIQNLIPNVRLKAEITAWQEKNGKLSTQVVQEIPLESAGTDYILKIKLLGDSGVGKSCLLLKYIEDTFTDSYISTIGVDFKVQTVNLDGKIVKLQIWDTAGQQRFRTIESQNSRGTHGALLVFDLTDADSFNDLKDWVRSLDEPSLLEKKHLVLIGAKSDLNTMRKVSDESAKAFANELGIQYFEVSSKNDSHVKAGFESLTRTILASFEAEKNAREAPEVKKFIDAFKASKVQKPFTNPFSFMSRKLRGNELPSLDEIKSHAKEAPNSRTAEVLTSLGIRF